MEKRSGLNMSSSSSISGLCRMLRNAHRAGQQKRRNFARRESRRKKNSIAMNVVNGMMCRKNTFKKSTGSTKDKNEINSHDSTHECYEIQSNGLAAAPCDSVSSVSARSHL